MNYSTNRNILFERKNQSPDFSTGGSPLQSGPQMNKFEQTSSIDHQMSLVGKSGARAALQVDGARALHRGSGALYSEAQRIMGNGHMASPCEQSDTTETLP